MAEPSTGTQRVGCLGAIGAVLAVCIGVGIFAYVTEKCECEVAAAVRSSTVECFVGGYVHFRNRPYEEACTVPGTTTTIEDSNALLTEEPVPSEEPIVTEEPVSTEPPTEPQTISPIMDGRVTYCREYQGQKYLNLPLNGSADPIAIQDGLNNGDITVQVGDTPGSCVVDAGYRLLVCAFPAGTFPVFSPVAPNSIINVSDRGTTIDLIPFDNSCEAEQQPVSSGDDDLDVPACDPVVPGTTCFCALNPADESCNDY